MIVNNIYWMDKCAKEASVELFNNLYTCEVFCHPCTLNIGDSVDFLYAIFVTDIFKENNENNNITKSNISDFAYNIIANVFNREKDIVVLNGLYIELDAEIPNDILNGETISFQCLRLDI